ncbi:purine-nucleoside phosphorylase [Paenibacillus herberti]|uniref:Purine nucleoside phosphorylase n=1 Tax=Paenibacillus herberti TaxID=1619309 RepID=A0A229P3T5_9BACL|nr:purine-nucleoside phosphorylase [Paenibacillus herberti]OXM16711.1 purine-nucleoside phosphorylase [Paenibacillus herberti]
MSTQETAKQIQEAVQFIRSQSPITPQVGLIMGSGLGILADYIEDAVTISYSDIPHFPVSTVEGHAGELLVGMLSGVPVILMKGRFHMYEGYGAELTAFPVRVMKALGADRLVVTNAAGGINTTYSAGDLMLITDHINFTGRNPLMGPNDNAVGVRFPDMSEGYSRRLGNVAREIAKEQGFDLREGVYLAVLGPSYETPAEIRMMRTLGADAVGMSTVTEVIAANHCGMEVVGISCITNMASGILNQPLSHEEVIETTERVKSRFLGLVQTLVARL